MARKQSLDMGNDNLTMLIDIILSLTPKQVEKEYLRMRTMYTNKGHTKIYNELGEEDKENGKIRLTRHQYKTIRTKYGSNYMNKALHTLTEYIKYLELHQDISKYKQKLLELNSRTHSKELSYGGWVYEKCKQWVVQQDEIDNLIINPFLIDDYSVAKKYIESLSIEMRKEPDVLWLVEKFPELKDLID